MTVGDVFDPVYEEIKGFDFGDNPRFHTRYDFYTDRVVLGFQDKILESSPDFLYAVGGDINGYTPTHNSKFQQPLTGDRTKDLSGNRTKRKFWTAMHQSRGAQPRAGAGPALPARHRRVGVGRVVADLRQGPALRRVPRRGVGRLDRRPQARAAAPARGGVRRSSRS